MWCICLACEIDIRKSIVVSIMIYTASNSVEDKYLRYAKLPTSPCDSHSMIMDLAYLARSACLPCPFLVLRGSGVHKRVTASVHFRFICPLMVLAWETAL